MNIQEVEYNPNLSPIRVIVGVIAAGAGRGEPVLRYTQVQREVLAGLNLTMRRTSPTRSASLSMRVLTPMIFTGSRVRPASTSIAPLSADGRAPRVLAPARVIPPDARRARARGDRGERLDQLAGRFYGDATQVLAASSTPTPRSSNPFELLRPGRRIRIPRDRIVAPRLINEIVRIRIDGAPRRRPRPRHRSRSRSRRTSTSADVFRAAPRRSPRSPTGALDATSTTSASALAAGRPSRPATRAPSRR